jgi:hypothetical protein
MRFFDLSVVTRSVPGLDICAGMVRDVTVLGQPIPHTAGGVLVELPGIEPAPKTALTC